MLDDGLDGDFFMWRLDQAAAGDTGTLDPKRRRDRVRVRQYRASYLFARFVLIVES